MEQQMNVSDVRKNLNDAMLALDRLYVDHFEGLSVGWGQYTVDNPVGWDRHKIPVIKRYRELTHCGLLHSKQAVEANLFRFPHESVAKLFVSQLYRDGLVSSLDIHWAGIYNKTT
jgi:hypothetical protein